MNSNTDPLLFSFNIKSIGSNFDTFKFHQPTKYKKLDILSFSESWLNDNNKNMYTIERYIRLFTMFDVMVAEVVYLNTFHLFTNPNRWRSQRWRSI